MGAEAGGRANATSSPTITSSTALENTATAGRNNNGSIVMIPTPNAISERERIRMEFYQTYDVMTGIRIAVTLGGFFGLMVLLVLYKSKCKSQPDEDLEAAISAAVVAEEEEMEAALNEGRLLSCGSGPRASLGNMSAPVYTRFSSVGGGYNSLLNPTIRNYQLNTRAGRVSLPTSEICFGRLGRLSAPHSDQEIQSRIYRSYNEEDENDLDEELEDDHKENYGRYLEVPNGVRKLSLLSESASDQLHLAVDETIDSGGHRHHHRHFHKKSDDLNVCNPIDIQVIQPTPQVSPRSSSSGLSENQASPNTNTNTNTTCPGHLFRNRCAQLEAAQNKLRSTFSKKADQLAPLASMGSCGALSSESSEVRSVGSDSVFTRNNEEADTDEDCNKSLKSDKEDCSIKSEPPTVTTNAIIIDDCTNKKYRIVSTSAKSIESMKSSYRNHNNRRSFNFGGGAGPTAVVNGRRRYSDSSVQIQRRTVAMTDRKSNSIRLFPIFKQLISGSMAYQTQITTTTNEMTDQTTSSDQIKKQKDGNSSSSSSSSVSSCSSSLSDNSKTNNKSYRNKDNENSNNNDSNNSSTTSGSSNYYSSASTLSNIGRKYSLTRIAVIEESSPPAGNRKQQPSNAITAITNDDDNTDVSKSGDNVNGDRRTMSSSKSCDRLATTPTNREIERRYLKTLSLKSLKSDAGWRPETLF